MIHLTPEPLPDHVTAPSTKPEKAKRKSKKTKSSDRWTQFNKLIDYYLQEVDGPAARLVLVTIFRHEKDKRSQISYQRIATSIGYSKSTVKRAVGKLKKSGFVFVVKQGGLHRGTNVYRVAFQELQGVTSAPP